MIELLRQRPHSTEFRLVDIARHAADTGALEVADRLDQLLCDISGEPAILDVMASRQRK